MTYLHRFRAGAPARAGASCSLTTENNDTLVYRTPYNAMLLAEFKARIPPAQRKWDANRKAWLVDAAYGQLLVDMTARILGEELELPVMRARGPVVETRLLDVRYVGACKDRGNGERTAFGHCGGEWSVVFTEKALRDWFHAAQRPDEAPTLYAILGLASTCAPQEIKSAYRRLALQWHPDQAKGEPDAAEQFMRIQSAYEVLREPPLRARYDAGLKLQASLTASTRYTQAALDVAAGYRAPLRCGLILTEGSESIGRFVVSKILEWQDITRADGKVLCTSWPRGADIYTESWA